MTMVGRSIKAGLKENVLLQVIVTLVIGTCGAVAAFAAGLPAAALIGSTLAVSAVSFCRLPTSVPPWLRNMAFAAIGCSLGSGVNTDFLEQAVKWPLSLGGLVLVMGVILLTSSWVLIAYFGQSKETAILAASPGALSYSLAIAATGVGDARAIVVIQSIRLLSITTGLPLVLDVLNLEHGSGGGGQQSSITLMATAGVFLLTLLFGFVLNNRKLPAAYLIAGVLVSGALHYLGFVSGRPQTGFLWTGFVITGAVIGARFTSIPLADIKRLVGGALAVVFVSSTISALFAALGAKLLGLPFGQIWVSYAPGGVEAMAAMALSLGYDSAFVATHHLFRIILLIFLLPVLLRALRKK
ncbi:MAG: membrane AbrB-like protein [Desulforhopalus sp.]|jgi:membrane AbrB-like protein